MASFLRHLRGMLAAGAMFAVMAFVPPLLGARPELLAFLTLFGLSFLGYHVWRLSTISGPDNHTVFVIDVFQRPVLELAAYDGVRQEILAAAERPGGFGVTIPSRWRFVFLGDPLNRATPVWSDLDKTIIHGRSSLVFRTFFDPLLNTDSKDDDRETLEPYTVVELTPDRNYRIYLKPQFSFRAVERQKAQLVCTFPGELLRPGTSDKTRAALLKKFGLREIENEIVDVFEDDFGEHHAAYSEGEGWNVYENSFFRFSVWMPS